MRTTPPDAEVTDSEAGRRDRPSSPGRRASIPATRKGVSRNLRPSTASGARNRSVPPIRRALRCLLAVVAVHGSGPGAGTGARGRFPLHPGDRRAASEPRAAGLADVPPHLRRMGIQARSIGITRANVASLEPVWTFSTGSDRDHQSPPIVSDGYMFVTTPLDTGGLQVLALEAATGDLRWRHVPGPAGGCPQAPQQGESRRRPVR